MISKRRAAAKRWNGWLRGGRGLAEAVAQMEQLGPLLVDAGNRIEREEGAS